MIGANSRVARSTPSTTKMFAPNCSPAVHAISDYDETGASPAPPPNRVQAPLLECAVTAQAPVWDETTVCRPTTVAPENARPGTPRPTFNRAKPVCQQGSCLCFWRTRGPNTLAHLLDERSSFSAKRELHDDCASDSSVDQCESACRIVSPTWLPSTTTRWSLSAEASGMPRKRQAPSAGYAVLDTPPRRELSTR